VILIGRVQGKSADGARRPAERTSRSRFDRASCERAAGATLEDSTPTSVGNERRRSWGPSPQGRLGGTVQPRPRHEAIALAFEQFRYGFANAISEEEARAVYEQYHVAGSGIPIFQAAFANINPRSETKADYKNVDRGPLLLIGGELDHQAPEPSPKPATRSSARTWA
jgi:hypothetical protein